MLTQPETRFARVGGDRVAYQVFGAGSHDLLYTLGFWNHLDIYWEEPGWVRYVRQLAGFCRVIRFDRRGVGLSDRPSSAGASPDWMLERWLEDCEAVLDDAGSKAPFFLAGQSADAAPLVLHFVDRHPDRCSGLILANTTACWAERPGYPHGHSAEDLARLKEYILHIWGTPEFVRWSIPSQADNEAFLRWNMKVAHSMASPRTAAENVETAAGLDARAVLPRIRVPTLVLARSHGPVVRIAQVRYLAEHIPGARFVELPGADNALSWETPERSLALIEEFVTGRHDAADVERTLATVLFTDIVGSTRQAATLGNAAWRELLDRHDRIVHEQVAAHRGHFVEASGDGTLMRFTSPRHAIDCALALRDSLKPLQIEIRAGVHCGEVELREDGRLGGMAVNFGARVMATAGAGEVLVSHSVQGAMMGSGYTFEERGLHELKGVPGRWPLYAVRDCVHVPGAGPQPVVVPGPPGN